MAQKLIDADILKLYCTGTDEDRKVIDKMYPGLFGFIQQDMFLAMLSEHKNKPTSKWIFNHNTKNIELEIQIIVTEKPGRNTYATAI